MKARFYRLTRDLHLYLGLFSSPFVLLFSVTVFFFVHAWVPKPSSERSNTLVISSLQLPADLHNLSGRPLVDALKPILQKAGVAGEIGFVRHLVNEQKFIIPVTVPGRETTVTITLTNREATVIAREIGLANALITLHKSPGPHGPGIRMNWFFMKAWRWMADATVYLVLFISISGIYLWYVLRSERKIGYILLIAGALSFFVMAYALSY